MFVVQRSIKIFRKSYFFFLFTGFGAIFFQAQNFAFCTPKMDSLTLKTWEKSPNNTEIKPNLSYSVSRGFNKCLAALSFNFTVVFPLKLKLISSKRSTFVQIFFENVRDLKNALFSAKIFMASSSNVFLIFLSVFL